jgi:hypothetical protein
MNTTNETTVLAGGALSPLGIDTAGRAGAVAPR